MSLPIRAAAWALTWALVQAAVPALGETPPGRKLVRTQAEYAEASKDLEPGNTLVLADGEWRDFEVVFSGVGRPDRPITLTAETKGEVFLTGRSNLRLAGEHLVVSGLVFKNGHSPTGAVIEFRKSRRELARHSRVTEVVIDHFDNPERFETDFWVLMYGRHNRFDHNYLAGKRNAGVTMAVRLDSEASQENHHRIDHNYFGPRPTLGSNGGETLRIGTSKYSLSDSLTVVENNYFERCNGEVEIISSKSGGNIFRGNVFFESRGTLTLRHGNGNLVEENVFFGNGVEHTGGIRVINKRQTVRNNYLAGLEGYRFGGALVIMNGVPNSPINRYHRVEDSIIENNTVIDSDHIELAAGSDEERSAVPVRTRFARNLIVNRSPAATIAAHDDLSGISFRNNVVDGVLDLPVSGGFEARAVELEAGSNGLLYPAGDASVGVGARRDLAVLERDRAGPAWYPKPDDTGRFDGGRTLRVEPGEDTLTEAVERSAPGDILELVGGTYAVHQILRLPHPITVRGGSSGARPRIHFRRSTLFELGDGGSLRLEGLEIDGSSAPDAYGNALIRTSRYSMLGNYQVLISDAEISNLDTNHSFDLLQVAKHTFADRVEIRDSEVRGVSGHVVELDREIDDLGIYNAEYVTITGSRFEKIGGAVAAIYRGGTDESTFGPHVRIEGNELTDVGGSKRNKTGASIFLHGAQVVSITGNRLRNSRPIRVVPTVGEPVERVEGNVVVPAASDPGDPGPDLRLLITSEELPSLRGSWRQAPLFAAALEQARKRIDAELGSLPDVPVPRDAGGGYTHEQHKRNGVAIHDAGMLYLWTGDRKYALHAQRLLAAYAELYPTLGEHPERKRQAPGRLFWQSLNEAVWLVYAIQGYDAVKHALGAADRQRIESRLLRPMADFLSVESPGTFDRIHNHGTWAVAAVGMTGYVLGDRDYVEQALLGLARDGEAGFLRQIDELFSPDGYYSEGPYYQRYALMPFVLFAEVIANNEPDRRIFDYRDGVLLRAIYTTIQLSEGGKLLPLNDAIKDKGLDTIELDYAIAIAYGLTSDASLLSLVGPQSRLVLTGDGLRLARAEQAGEGEPFPFRSLLLRGGARGDRGALAILRSGAAADASPPGPSASAGSTLVLEATAHGMGHGHFDRLGWMFYDEGREIISDYGAARFLNVVQKNGGRYLPENKSWAKQTVAHNTLVVDGRSQFGGDRHAAERRPPEVVQFSPVDNGEPGEIQVVSARDVDAYPGVEISRTLAMLTLPELEHPLILDILHARGDRPRRYDLPLYYQGQRIQSRPPAVAEEILAPVGSENGYQHLWSRGRARVVAGDSYALTWLNGGRFYTYSATASADMEVLSTEVGASDPDFNLRSEPGLMLRVPSARDVTFFSVLEPHGEYDGAREITRRSHSRILRLEGLTADSGADVAHLLRFETAGGRRVSLAVSTHGDAETEHRMSLPEGDRRWTGFFHLLSD
ncbi:MAG: heparinase II/III family protein [Holophagales bacterium]|nr:heparinase II/III family protein [Holophagales bacterium]